MATARKHTIIPGQPGFFHCVSRCVRRAWLCGTDPATGNNYDHRREWMCERMRLLTTCFAIDVYAYALMSNHYHIVFYIDPQRVELWSDEEVIERWKKLWSWRRVNNETAIPKSVPTEVIEQWRQRLGNVSWVMRLLNEPMARIANTEDGVKGHFWESRFKCNPLLDDEGLSTCMVYADLNPIKAGIAKTPEKSDYTSIQQRIRELAPNEHPDYNEADKRESPKNPRDIHDRRLPLLPVCSENPEQAPTLSISPKCYIDLVESTAEAIQQKQQFPIATETLISLGIKPAGWLRAMKDFTRLFRTAAGSEVAFTDFMKKTDRTRRQDASARRLLFS